MQFMDYNKLTIQDQENLRAIKKTIKKTCVNCNQIIMQAWESRTYPIYLMSDKQKDELRRLRLIYPLETLQKYLRKA